MSFIPSIAAIASIGKSEEPLVSIDAPYEQGFVWHGTNLAFEASEEFIETDLGFGSARDPVDHFRDMTLTTAVDRGASWEEASKIADSVAARSSWMQFKEGKDPEVPYGLTTRSFLGQGGSSPSTSFADYINPTVRDLESQSDIPLIPRTLIYEAEAPDPESYDPYPYEEPHKSHQFSSRAGFVPKIQTGRSVFELYDPGNEDFNVKATEQIQDVTTEFLQPLIDTVPVTPEARAAIRKTMRGAIMGQYAGAHHSDRGAVMGGILTSMRAGGETRRRDSRVASTIVHEGAHEWEELHNVMSYIHPDSEKRITRPEWIEAFRAGGGQWLLAMIKDYDRVAGNMSKIMGFYNHHINGDGADYFVEQYGALASLAYELNPDDPLSVIRKANPAVARFYEGFFEDLPEKAKTFGDYSDAYVTDWNTRFGTGGPQGIDQGEWYATDIRSAMAAVPLASANEPFRELSANEIGKSFNSTKKR